ncbi:TIGR04076 family protein [Agrobacterium sp. a22-2]|uniref:TIGR04076 family protein n=1 Tax=Agrobacterium sp. a22-2 TaxID=2283840 RepID=UPI001445F4E2|nr:TIGR04076 family protein [Agrobacterium sp. a22-2]NKN39305.1 TIGR04076 family protein [Agrobacterium sp. a22-2]
MPDEPVDDGFELYDLRVEAVIPEGKPIYCGAKPGDYFELKGEMLSMPAGQGFSIYSISAVLPLLAAKQRPTHKNDWMTSDAEIACPDPHCASRLKIVRLGTRRFSHAETTAVPLPKESE